LFENDLISYGASPAQVRAMAHELGLKCFTLQPFRDFEGMPPELRARTFDRIERKFDLMQALGTDLLLICSNVSPSCLPDRSRIVEDFRELGERAARRGLRVGYEALAWGRHINDHRDAWSIVEAAAHPAVGLILDTFHSLAREIPIASLNAIAIDKVFLLQVADAPLVKMDYLSWSRHLRCMPGQGELPVFEYVSMLAARGYAGALSLEIFNDRFRAGSAGAVALDGKRSLVYLRDEIAQRHPLASHARLPPRVRCSAIEFIEFALDEAELRRLTPMLSALGFDQAGQHRRKSVSRWCQGDINLVLNSEPEGFAHAYNGLHGASVCAFGLRVGSADDAMKRAQALQIQAFERGRWRPHLLHAGG